MGVFEWVVAGFLLCILFAILRVIDHIKQESFWIKDHLKMLKKATEENTFVMKDELKAIERNTARIKTY